MPLLVLFLLYVLAPYRASAALSRYPPPPPQQKMLAVWPYRFVKAEVWTTGHSLNLKD